MTFSYLLDSGFGPLGTSCAAARKPPSFPVNVELLVVLVAEIVTAFVSVFPIVSVRRREGEVEDAIGKSRGRAKIIGMFIIMIKPKKSNEACDDNLAEPDFEFVAISFGKNSIETQTQYCVFLRSTTLEKKLQLTAKHKMHYMYMNEQCS